MEGIRKFLVTQVTNEDNLKSNMQFLQEKLTLLLHFITSLFTSMSSKFDEKFSLETLSETFHQLGHIFLTVILPDFLIALVVFYCCYPCIWYLLQCIFSWLMYLWSCFISLLRCLYICFCCCCPDLPSAISGLLYYEYGMMVAPGRDGLRMPRSVFERNPRSYFRDLRAGRTLVY